MTSKKLTVLTALTIYLALGQAYAQDLMDMLGEDKPTTEYAYATFKATRIVNGQSIENPANGVLLFTISHHFQKVNTGAYEFFGLDHSTIRLGLDYGVNDYLSIGIGRSSFEKTYDASIKAKILRQSSGERNMPITLSLYSSVVLNSLHWQYPDRKNYFSSRLSYTNQLLIARKFSNSLSLQLTPTFVHKNFVPTAKSQNDIFAVGFGGRYKLTQRLAVNAEYFYLLPGNTADIYENSFSIGVDIETGGHVFQLHFTNAQPMFDRAFITETTGKWSKGDIYFGFNISRVFTIKKPKTFKNG
jgi:opacity protein-like surface antigen